MLSNLLFNTTRRVFANPTWSSLAGFVGSSFGFGISFCDQRSFSDNLIRGKAIANQIQDELKVEVAEFKASTGVDPSLAVVLVGARADSATYVRNKKKSCKKVRGNE